MFLYVYLTYIKLQTVSGMYTNNAIVCMDGHDEMDPLSHKVPRDVTQYDAICQHDVEQLSLEIEKERLVPLGPPGSKNDKYTAPSLLRLFTG